MLHVLVKMLNSKNYICGVLGDTDYTYRAMKENPISMI